ncbi:MAG: hypothetical protein RL375_3432 [Pseudomonadota bacterium]|jgi:hypothetical protein
MATIKDFTIAKSAGTSYLDLAGATRFDLLDNVLQKADISFINSTPKFTPVVAAPVAPRAEPLIEPTYGKATETFGVMRQIDPVRDHFLIAVSGLEALRRIATERDGSQALPLIKRIETFLKEHLEPADFTRLMADLGARADDPLSYLRKPIVKLGSKVAFPATAVEGNTAAADDKLVHNAHSSLFGVGAVVIDDIRVVEALHQALVKLRRAMQKSLADKQARLAELQGRIPPAGAALESAERQRSEELDDYAVAQQVLAEHWRSVEAAHAERRRVIDSHVGLYYVKVRETPLGRPLPDPLALRFTSADDLVPGCGPRDTPLADELQPFMDAVLDIPVADWSVLNGLAHLLPGPQRLLPMVAARKQRLAQRSTQVGAVTAGLGGRAAPALGRLLQHNLSLAGELIARPINAASLVDLQRQSHAVLALEDLLACPVPLLREPATALRQRLDGAAGCLLAHIKAVTPSLRLTWAAAAEADTLPVDTPERWPGLERAEAADFNAVRTLVELVGWWFRQLDGDAAGASRTAMRHLVRACLLLAAGDDPDQLLQGRVSLPPARLRVGETLRLQLNRVPTPGALLQLTDDQQRVVGTLRVDDHDVNGTLARFTSVVDPAAVLSTASRVSGQRL